MATKQTPPGPRGLPLVGNTHQWARDPNAFRERCAAEYGPVVNYEMLGWDTYMVTDPSEIERILVAESERFPKHDDSNSELKQIVGDGLITSEGDLWQRQREAIQPAFYMDHIREYADIMVSRSEETSARWTAGETVEMREEMTRLTLEILVDAMFGRDIDIAERGIYDAVEAFQKPMQPKYQPITFFAPDWTPLPFLRRANRAHDHLHEQVDDIIDQRRTRRERGGQDADRDDLLSMLLDADTEMSDEQIRDEMMTFLFAGHETTALSLTFTWDLLSRNPGAADRLRAELDETLDGRPTIEDVFELDYTEAVVRESMRLYPPAHEIRRQPADDVEIAGYRVPKGALVVLPTWVLHRDGRYWDDPEAFRPERWLPTNESETDRPEFAYFPFGGGPRHCIGHRFAMTEAQLVLATLASEWTLDRQYDDLAVAPAVTLQPKTDIEMAPHPR
ncbi:cytochrome P450 [Salinibaculum salinum]|uniref:cytochrome P450 n=1 Tax=Salinibaculum salinum TaxID=3131996 RepID=UPI0030ED430A